MVASKLLQALYPSDDLLHLIPPPSTCPEMKALLYDKVFNRIYHSPFFPQYLGSNAQNFYLMYQIIF